MDVRTKAKYEEWKWNRIKRRVIFPSIGLLIILMMLVFIIVSCNSDEEAETTRSTRSFELPLVEVEVEPIVYLFNAHPLEMIGSTHENPFVGDMSIVELTHILAGHLESHDIPTLVEERCVDALLSENNWEFYMSYYAAGYFVRDAKAQYPSLAFFVDLHRDGIPHEYATAFIDGESYARVLFVIGTDNPMGYAESYLVATELHEMLEERKPGISRGIFFSGGPGRDGVYSQNISPMIQLIELGTVDSTVEEASRTIEVLAEVLAEYLSLSDEDEDEDHDYVPDSDNESEEAVF